MLETYFAAPKTLERLRAGPSGPYMDGFAASLIRDGYRAATAVRYLRAAAHLGHFLQGRGGTLANIDLSAFFQHLRTCRCPRSKRGRRNHHTSFGAKRYRDYLVQIGVCRCSVMPEIQSADPALVVEGVQSTFKTLIRTAGLWPAPNGRRPRLHDLRHTFAVRALQASPAGRRRIGQHMVALATYLGHVNIYATYWYLEATADLLRDIADTGETFMCRGEQ